MNNNIFNLLPQIKSNPMKFIGEIQGVNMNNPNEIIQYGLNNGKFTQEQYNRAVSIARQMGFKG